MNTIKVLFKKLSPDAKIPQYSKEGDACVDITCLTEHYNADYDYVEFSTGLAIKIPQGHVGLIFPRSSISNTSHSLRNSVAVIDENYTGELKLRFSTKEDQTHLDYHYGDRIGQLMVIPIPRVEFEEVEELPSTNRGNTGFGSSGR